MRKKFAIDMLLNIVATAIPIAVLQLVLLPAVARFMDADKYGLLVTILALLNVIPSSFGNVLNNVRLIEGNTNSGDAKDYNCILSIMLTVSSLIVLFATLLYDPDANLVSLLLTVLIAVFLLMREYFVVAFRLDINYVAITINNIIMVIGYIIGFVIFTKTGYWQWMYLVGYSVSLVYIFSRSNLWKEPLSISRNFQKIGGQSLTLFVATLLGRITTYADKMIIFPFLGGATVSVYYAATLFGKVVSMAIVPTSGVMLSYLSKSKAKNNKVFRMTFLCALSVCITGYFVCVGLSRPVLGVLYPQFVDEAMHFVWITTGTMVISALTSIVNPFVLKFYAMTWQIAINVVYVVVYLIVSLSLLHALGLMGFCIGTLIATFLKLMFMLLVFSRFEEKKNNLWEVE